MSKSVKSDTKSKVIDGEEIGTVMLMGRPTKYKPEYCQMLINHMSEGYSFESFGAIISVDRTTLYHWETLFKEFSHCKGIARNKQLLHDEILLKELTKGEHGKSASAAAHIYKMKCSHQGWIEKQVIEQTNKNIEIKIDSDDASL
jgi:transposase